MDKCQGCSGDDRTQAKRLVKENPICDCDNNSHLCLHSTVALKKQVQTEEETLHGLTQKTDDVNKLLDIKKVGSQRAHYIISGEIHGA